MRRPIAAIVASILAALAVLSGAAPASGAQRIDMKVLLLGTSTSESDFASWKDALQREGVPFETIITSTGHAPITAATLSDTLANGTPEAKYQAVVVSVGDLPECTESGCTSTLSQAEWTVLEEYEHKFNVRQLTGDIYPGAPYGLSSPTTSGALDGTQGTLTSEGKAAFPYLNGPVAMDTGTYGYEATPLATQVAGASFRPLVSEAKSGAALVGIYSHPNGVEEMVETFDENQYQLQAELLRHGALNWVTRGVYFGDQRSYVEMDIDDTFSPDDAWSTTTHQNEYTNFASALRMGPTDVDYAAKWSEENKFRMDQLFNGGNSVVYQEEHSGPDPLLAEFQKTNPATGKPYADSFGWLSHTYDTPVMDVGCATQNYIEAELNENTSWAAEKPGATPGTGGIGLSESTEPSVALGAENPKVFVPGNHSGFADLVPGNPATVDPPEFNSASTHEKAGGTLPAGTYVYAISDQFTDSPTAGQTTAAETEPLKVAAGATVELQWESICHASDYLIYREVAASNKWSLIDTVSTPQSATLPDASSANPVSTTNVKGGGETEQVFTDTGATGTPEPAGWTPPSVNTAVESGWEQNPYFIPALEAVGITAVGADASKGYPDPAEDQFGIGTNYTGPEYGAGESFVDGTAQVVPRHPINIYYNASTEAQEVDEYNTLYEPVSMGGECVPSSTTTCETTPATFAGIISSVVSGMFQEMMANDPRPNYVHQTNLLGQPPPGPATSGTPPKTPDTTGDGLLYSVLNPLLAEYHEYFTASAPYEQLTLGAISNVLAEQTAWKAALSAGTVSGYIEGNQITINNTGSGAVNAPLTGVTGVGSAYGGITSGWTSVPVATSIHSAPTTWPAAPLSITTASLPEGRLHTGYAQTLAAGGGAAPYSWSLSSGSLPAGLSLNATNGAISGTPSSAGTSSFTVKVTDSSTPTPQSITATLSISVLPNPPAVATGVASSIAQATATLKATVNPAGGSVTECSIEYGTTISYGHSVACTPAPGSGESAVAVSSEITGLSPDTTYHFRVSAANAGGSSDGSDETFKTLCTVEGFCTSFDYSEPSAFASPSAVAVDPSGDIWVAGGHDQVLEFNSKREYVRQFGSEGSGSGQFNGIGGIASNSSGDIYVTDVVNNRVEEFSPTGAFLRQFGSSGTGAGEFSAPTGIAIDSSGNVWVLNTHGVLVQEFSATGTYISGFASSGWFTGGDSGIAFSGANLYVTEPSIGRVQEYSTSGSSLAIFDERGSGNGKSQIPAGIATDPTTGNLYVTDTGSDRVQEFSPAGAFIATFGSGGSGAGQFSDPKAVAVGPYATVYVADTANSRSEEFTAPKVAGEAPAYATSFGHSELSAFASPNAVAVDPSGDIWVAGGHDQVLEFNSKREYLRQFGSEGTGSGQFNGIGGIASDSSGDIWVTDAGNNRVQEFSSTGGFLRQFGSAGLAAGEFSTPTGIAIDSAGNVWVLNTHGVLVQEFSATGTYISGFGSSGWVTGGDSGIAFSGANLYVTEPFIGRVQEYSTSGSSLAIFDERGSGNGKSQIPSGIATEASTGNLYVTDSGSDLVQEFSSAGTFIATFGSAGSGAGQFSDPKAVAVASGHVFVADTANGRIEEWVP